MAQADKKLGRWSAITALLLARTAGAAVLPDDRADIFYSNYSGGGMDITGKSVSVRKKFSEQLGVEADYFIDTVTGASIDVLSSASTIHDQRTQKSLALNYIRDKTEYTLSYTNSVEDDYVSNTTHFGLSQDMFGDLTTVTLGFTNTRNLVGEHNGSVTTWLAHAYSLGYEAGVSQILTKNLIAGVTFEVVTDQGYLANPYRSIRFLDPSNAKGYSLGAQVYPGTHTSDAIAARAKYYLPNRAALAVSYRYYADTWAVRANTAELGYTQPIGRRWIVEGRVRYYQQGHASFYSDLFPFAGSQNFMARDQTLAASTNLMLDAKATYAFLPDGWKIFKRGTATLEYSRISFKYGDFRNIKNYGLPAYQPGSEPLYHFDANVWQIYLSMFF
ncbi:MAG TPA: DUF3570 domain-containing protein [Steroidobacteraceae bacterium]|nr:DUF3570 domain-containing protein [Steroidobacteraceae bacterium]